MTLDEYEQFFLKERMKKRKNEKMVGFFAGIIIGQIIGVMALALVSINRGEDD